MFEEGVAFSLDAMQQQVRCTERDRSLGYCSSAR